MAGGPVDPTGARLFGVIGWPVAHSRSPAIHAAAYRALGIDAEYLKLPLPPELFAAAVRALPASGFGGVNVTVPHKLEALAQADRASEAARAIGAANTLTFEPGGEIMADNTDAPGMLAALPRDPAGSKALVLGAGGTARAAVWALREAGAEVAIWNRTPERARTLAAEFGAAAVDDLARALEGAALLVNCTTVGMTRPGESPASLTALGVTPGLLRPDLIVVDFVYGAAPTELALAAAKAGATVVDGGELLVRQGALSFERWFARAAPVDAMRDAISG